MKGFAWIITLLRSLEQSLVKRNYDALNTGMSPANLLMITLIKESSKKKISTFTGMH
jgi:hypothetical protein